MAELRLKNIILEKDLPNNLNQNILKPVRMPDHLAINTRYLYI